MHFLIIYSVSLYFQVVLLLSAIACMANAENKPPKGLVLNHCKFFKKPQVGSGITTTPQPVKSTTPVPVEITTTTEPTSYPPVPPVSEVMKHPPHREVPYPSSDYEWQYSPLQDGQYPPQPEVQYFPVKGGMYPPQFGGLQRQPQQEAQRSPQQGYQAPQQEQQPPQQDGQQPLQQDGQQPPLKDGQQPPQQNGQLLPQQEAQYPLQQELQYPAHYQGYPYNYRPSEFPYIQSHGSPIQKSIGLFNTQKLPKNQGLYYVRQPHSYGYYSSPYFYLPKALNIPQVPIRGNIKST